MGETHGKVRSTVVGETPCICAQHRRMQAYHAKKMKNKIFDAGAVCKIDCSCFKQKDLEL
jgi:hypothetical protein